MTLFEALTGGAIDHLNWQHSGEFDQNLSKKSNPRGFAWGGGGMGGFGIDRYINQLSNNPAQVLLYVNSIEKWTGMKNTGLKMPEADQIYVQVGCSYY